MAAKYLQGIFSAGHLVNCDSRGDGPGGILIGRTICYTRKEFLIWLEARIKSKKKIGKIGEVA